MASRRTLPIPRRRWHGRQGMAPQRRTRRQLHGQEAASPHGLCREAQLETRSPERERQIKRWSLQKKELLVSGDVAAPSGVSRKARDRTGFTWRNWLARPTE